MNKVIGVTINDYCITMAQVVNKKVNIATEKLPKDLIISNQIQSDVILAKLIKKLKNKGKFVGNECSLILPHKATYFKMISSPILNDYQLKLNLPYQFKDYLQNLIDDYNYDYIIKNTVFDDKENPISINLALAAGNKLTIKRYQEILKKAGLRLKKALPEEISVLNLVNYVNNLKKLTSQMALVFIDYDITKVFIFDNNDLQAVKTIDLGCHDIDKAIGEYTFTNEYIGSDHREHNFENILENACCKTIYEKISLEVMKTINFYNYQNHDKEITSIYFGASGGKIQPLKDMIVQYTSLQENDLSALLPAAVTSDQTFLDCLLAIGATL